MESFDLTHFTFRKIFRPIEEEILHEKSRPTKGIRDEVIHFHYFLSSFFRREIFSMHPRRRPKCYGLNYFIKMHAWKGYFDFLIFSHENITNTGIAGERKNSSK